MAHHGSKPPNQDYLIAALQQAEREALSETLGLGGTGRYPDGAINEHDEGEIAFGITATRGRVVIEFGKPVHWLGLTAMEARKLALLLNEHAAKANEQKRKGKDR